MNLSNNSSNNISLNQTSDQVDDFTKHLQNKYDYVNKVIFYSFVVLIVNILLIFFFENFFYTSYNIVTILFFLSILCLSYILTKRKGLILTYSELSEKTYERISYIAYLNFALFIIITTNFFYTLFDRFIFDVFNIINVVDSNVSNLAYFYAAMLIYATMNISIPLIIFYESNKIKAKIKLYVKAKKIGNGVSSLHTTSSENELANRYHNV